MLALASIHRRLYCKLIRKISRSFLSLVVISSLVLSAPHTSALSPSSNAPNNQAVETPEIIGNENQPVQLTYNDLLIAESVTNDEVLSALEGVDVDYELVGPAPYALPLVAAAAAVAVVGWCAKGALTSIPASGIQHLVSQADNGIEPPDYVMNAIFGCAGGGVVGTLTTQWMRVQFAGAVLAFVIKIRNFG